MTLDESMSALDVLGYVLAFQKVEGGSRHDNTLRINNEPLNNESDQWEFVAHVHSGKCRKCHEGFELALGNSAKKQASACLCGV